jgi:hypothetical protein
MPTTLNDHLSTQLAALTADHAALAAALPGLRAAEGLQRAAAQAARQALQAVELQLAQVQAQLAEVELQAAGDPLLRQLQAARIERAEAQTALLAAEEGLLKQQQVLAQQTAQFEAWGRRIEQLRAQQLQLQPQHAARQALLARLAGARLAVQDEAQAALAAQAAAAETQLNLDLPATLLARLTERHGQLQALQARLETTRDTAVALEAALQPASQSQFSTERLARAEALAAHLPDAVEAVRAARRRLAQLAARPARLNVDERAALNAAPAASAAMSTRPQALTKQADYDAKRLLLAEKDGERRRIHLQLRLANPADFPPAAGARKTQYDGAQAALDAAQADFNAADSGAAGYSAKHRKAMNDWLACVSEALWADLEQYLADRALLRRVDSADPAALRTALEAAETAVVDASKAVDTARLKSQLAARETEALAQWLLADPGGNGRRLREGLRTAA